MPDQNILVTGGAGFIGQFLVTALVESSPDVKVTITDVIEPPIPSSVSAHKDRITTVKSDLTNPATIDALLSSTFTAVYLLHGLMSGGAEANLELGWRVNWDSHRGILDHLRTNNPGTVTVFTSSLAVYGPSKAGEVTNELTCPIPQTSYGAQKLMVETYIHDFSRRGLLDGRVVRLPTVIVRPGAPSAAASSFASGIVREPLKGEKTILPVSRDLEMWVCSPQAVVKNLVYIKDIPKEKFFLSRVVNLPGITVTVDQIVQALEAVGGQKAVSLIEEARDPKIEAIVGSWPARFDIEKATSLGLRRDRSLIDTVKAFAESLDQ
ncbi:NAD-dependent epimerase/dehydratase [Xylariaceae sp. FL0255]|nr:NAD-dependent epimerase/dehydratase [Xylariaceae sp. FL0255]